MQSLGQSCVCRRPSQIVSTLRQPRTRSRPVCGASKEPQASPSKLPVVDIGSFSVVGTSRKANEDRFDYKVIEEAPQIGGVNTFIGVYDGHGGPTVAQWLEQQMSRIVGESWEQYPPEEAISRAFLEADKKLLQVPGGFFGAFGERGIGGSKCGSTGVVALIYEDKSGMKLLSANAGDSRVVLIRNGKATGLTEDHVPDIEAERERIESENPNPKLPLVRYVAGTWRVGGILALSRAFGDAYLKGSLQFEGIDSGTGYSSGFGVIADPYISITSLEGDDSWLIVHSDGMNDTTSRGGGGGIDNDELASICKRHGSSSADELAEKLCNAAQKNGSTDDVSVVCAQLKI